MASLGEKKLPKKSGQTHFLSEERLSDDSNPHFALGLVLVSPGSGVQGRETGGRLGGGGGAPLRVAGTPRGAGRAPAGELQGADSSRHVKRETSLHYSVYCCMLELELEGSELCKMCVGVRPSST